MSVVTIRGQCGSGAAEVGRQIADRLHVDYVDREIIAEVAARLHREEQEVVAKEMPPGSLLGRVVEALGRTCGVGYEGAYLPLWQMPLDDARYFEALKSVVRELARSESLVILGRGSQFILKDYPGTLHVLLVAPIEFRVKRVMQDLKLKEEAAKQEIENFDKSSREFIKRYFQAEWEDPINYDLVINTEHLSYPAVASIVFDTASYKNGAQDGQGTIDWIKSEIPDWE
jgi:cytidylate kinase